MQLAHEVFGDGRRSLALAHGILGSGRNLAGLARRLVERLPGWRVVTVDLRNHGDSGGAAPPHTIAACAGDLERLFETIGAPAAAVGHSFGAKVALAWAAGAAHPPDQLWLLDAPLGAGQRGPPPSPSSEVARVIAAVSSVPMPIASRAALIDALRARGLPEAVCLWMTTNLRERDGQLTWRFVLAAIPEMLESFEETDLWPALERLGRATRVFLVCAGQGGRFSDAERARIAAAAARGALTALFMPRAGHWLHTEDPEGLLALMVPRLKELGGGTAP